MFGTNPWTTGSKHIPGQGDAVAQSIDCLAIAVPVIGADPSGSGDDHRVTDVSVDANIVDATDPAPMRIVVAGASGDIHSSEAPKDTVMRDEVRLVFLDVDPGGFGSGPADHSDGQASIPRVCDALDAEGRAAPAVGGKATKARSRPRNGPSTRTTGRPRRMV